MPTMQPQTVNYQEALFTLFRNLDQQDRVLVLEYACALLCRERLAPDNKSRVLPFRVKLGKRRKVVTV